MAMINWGNAVSGDWSDASDWTPGTVPGTADDVVISAIGPIVVLPCGCPEPTPYDISLSLSTRIRSLTLDGDNATLGLNGGRLVVRKNVVNGHGNTIDLENRSVVTIDGTLVNNGTVELDDATGAHSSQLFVNGNLINNDTLLIAADNHGNGRSTLTVAGTLINRGGIEIGGEQMNRPVSVSAGAYAGTGELSLIGGQANEASLIVAGAAPTVLQGVFSLEGDALLQFGSGAITAIGVFGDIQLLGPDAQIAIAGASGSNSALTGLTSNAGEFTLGDGASVATASGVDFRNNGLIVVTASPVPGGDPTLMSTLSIGGDLINNGLIGVGEIPLGIGPIGLSFGNGTLAVAGTIVNHNTFLIGDPDDSAPASATATAVVNIGGIEISGGALTITGDVKNFNEIDLGMALSAGPFFPSPIGSSSLTVDGTFYNLGGELSIGGPIATGPATVSLGGLINAGFIGVGSGSGETASLTVTGATNNQGTILAIAGGSAALLGDVSGRGTAEIGVGGTIEFGGVSTNAVTFDDVTGILKLDTAQSFNGTVSGLMGSDGIDLANFEFANGAAITNVSGSGNAGTTTRVTIGDGALSVTLRLLNSFAGEFAANAGAYTLTADTAATHQGSLFQLAASGV